MPSAQARRCRGGDGGPDSRHRDHRTVVVPPGPVAADQVSNLKAQANQIAQDLVLEQLQIGTYQQQYDVDTAKVQRDEAEIGSSENQIQADTSRVRRDRERLESEAVSAYINMDPEVSGSRPMFEGNQNEAPTRAEYEEVASGDITLTIDGLHTDENGLRAERATLEQQEAQDQATTNQEATLANAARQTEVELQSKQSEITGELAVAVAQQQAAQAAAAAAAVRAAQAAAARPLRPPHSRRAGRRRAQLNLASLRHVHGSTGERRQHFVRRPCPASLSPMRPAGRVRRQLRRRLAGRHVHGWFPVQPGHVERSGPACRHAAAHQRPPEQGDSGRAGRPRHRALRCRRRAVLERLLSDELTPGYSATSRLEAIRQGHLVTAVAMLGQMSRGVRLLVDLTQSLLTTPARMRAGTPKRHRSDWDFRPGRDDGAGPDK